MPHAWKGMKIYLRLRLGAPKSRPSHILEDDIEVNLKVLLNISVKDNKWMLFTHQILCTFRRRMPEFLTTNN
jgi:hypothetical protein